MNKHSKQILSLVLMIFGLGITITTASKSNLCPYDDNIIYEPGQGEQVMNALTKCGEAEMLASKYIASFEGILFKGKESKRQIIINRLTTNYPKNNVDKKYLFGLIKEGIRLNGYILNNLETCDNFDGIFMDMSSISLSFRKNEQGCLMKLITNNSNIENITSCNFNNDQIIKRSETSKAYYQKTQGYGLLDKWYKEFENIISNDESICKITYENEASKKQSQLIEHQQQKARIIADKANLQQLMAALAVISQTEKYPKKLDTLSPTYLSKIPKKITPGSICNQSGINQMYYSDENRFAFIVPTYTIGEHSIDQKDVSTFIGDPAILLNNCKTIKRELFEKKPGTDQFKYEDYSCAKDISKCKSTDYVTIIYSSAQN